MYNAKSRDMSSMAQGTAMMSYALKWSSKLTAIRTLRIIDEEKFSFSVPNVPGHTPAMLLSRQEKGMARD